MSKAERVAGNLVWLEAFSFLWLIIAVILMEAGYKWANFGVSLGLPFIGLSLFISGVWGIWKGYILTGVPWAEVLRGKWARVQGFIQIIIALLLMVFPVWSYFF